MRRFRQAMDLVIILAAGAALTACRSDDGQRPPIFGAVFGMEGAQQVPFQRGKLDDPLAHPGDRLIGSAANSPGLCIHENAAKRRFRAACPAGGV